MSKKSFSQSAVKKTSDTEQEVKNEKVVAEQPAIEESKVRPGSFAALISQ